MMSTTERAREFAIAAHGDQRYGIRPYSVHLDDVARIVAEYGAIATQVAYLHDVVEDTTVQIDEIVRLFGQDVADCVALLTDEPGANRKERKARTNAKLAATDNRTALLVKAADRLANVRTCAANGDQSLWRMYKREHPAFRDAVHRPDLCNTIWNELEDELGFVI